MTYIDTFARREIKYMLTREQRDQILQAMQSRTHEDEYGFTTIRNIYYDTSSYQLIRHSLEKPVYKEKLRIRSYSQVKDTDNVFVELKKKYDAIVYKRRISIENGVAKHCFTSQKDLPNPTQITQEINYFRNYYETLRPVVFLSYNRQAYVGNDDSGLRITFDENILYRTHDFNLSSTVYGTPLLDDDHVLMEIKISNGMPLWLSHLLNELHIYKTSFSKYGSAYTNLYAKGELI